MIYRLIQLNGIYDIICALSLLNYIPYLRYLHLNIIKHHHYKNKLFERFFAYWIFTYGVIRIYGDYRLSAYSYYLEAGFILNEYVNNYAHNDQSLFVIISSIFMGSLCFLNL